MKETFLPDIPIYPEVVAACWFGSTSSLHLLGSHLRGHNTKSVEWPKNINVWYTSIVYNNHISSKVRIVYTWHTAWLGVKLRGLYSEHLCSSGTVRTTYLVWVNVEIHPYCSEYFIALLYTVELEAENIIWLMSETSYSTDGFHRLKGAEHTVQKQIHSIYVKAFPLELSIFTLKKCHTLSEKLCKNKSYKYRVQQVLQNKIRLGLFIQGH